MRFLAFLGLASLAPWASGCSCIVAGKLDALDGDADVDTDADTDVACSLEGNTAVGTVAPREIDFAGGTEGQPVLIQTGREVSAEDGNLALIARWTENGDASFGYETQLFDERWTDATAHNRIVQLDQNPQTRGALASTDDRVFAAFAEPTGTGSDLQLVPMRYDAVANELQEDPRTLVWTHASTMADPMIVLAGTNFFYIWGEAPSAGIASVFAATAPIDGVIPDILQLDQTEGLHQSPSAAFSTEQARLVFVFERQGATVSNVLWGILDTAPSVVRAAEVMPPVGRIPARPVVAAGPETALVVFSAKVSETADFDLLYQIVDIASGDLPRDGNLSELEGSNAIPPAVTYHPDLDEFGVVWIESGGDITLPQVWAARIDTSGGLLQGPDQIADAQAEEGGSVSIAPVSFGYALTWDAPERRIAAGWYGCVPEGE